MATVVTRKGKEIVATRMKGAPSAGTEPLNIGWGTGGVAGGPFTAAATDVGPFSEASEARVVGTSTQVTTTTTNDTYQVTGTITAGGTKTIAEVFLSDSATKPTPVDTVQTSSTVIGSAVGTTVIVATGGNFSANQFIQIRTEVMQISSIATNTLTVTRGQNGSSAISTIALGDQVTGGNAPGSTAVTNGNIFLHADFTGIALNASDSIAFTVKTQFT